MSEGAAQNGGTNAAAAGEAAAAAPAAVTATAAAAAAAPAANGAVAAAPAPMAPVAAAPVPLVAPVANPVHVVAAAPAAVAPAPHHKDEADCKPKKVAAKDGDKDAMLGDDADQNLSQPADGCVLPADGQAAAPAAPAQESAPVVVDDGEGGGISSGLLIGAGVLAAIGVGVLALSKDDEDDNSPPVANADTATATEGGALVSGNVSSNDSDPDGDTLTYTLNGTAPAGLTFNNNGSFSFDPTNAAYNSLAAGATQTISVPYTVTDSEGATATSTLTITLTGTNDNPTVTAVTGPTATEGGAAVTATVAATDPDQGAVLTYSLVNPVAGVTINSTTGVVTLNPADPAYNALAAGQTQQVVVAVRATDAQNGSQTGNVTFTVTGTNDAPVAANVTAAGNEDTQITGNLSGSDVDANTTLTYAIVGTAPAGFTFNATTGAFTLDTTNAAYQPLAAGQTQDVVVTYTVSDGTATSAPATVTIRVTGTADDTSLDIDNDSNINTARTFDAAGGGVSFTDDDDIANTAIINNFGADDYITFDAPFNGSGSVSFGSGDFDGDGVTDDLRITTNKGGQASVVTLTNVVAPGTVVFNEATAEAAVAGTDNFRTTTQSATPTAASLDVDSDSNTGTRFTIAPNANTNTFAYTDDATFANTVRINDFGADDTITFNTAQANVSFTSGDFDNDTFADDVRITVNNPGGTVSDITLIDAVAAGTVVTSAASAEAAIGAGTTNFIYNGTVIAPPPPPPAGTTAVNLDIDNDANIDTRREFNALSDGFRFTDDADVANRVAIINFGTNDRIVFEANNTYSFSNRDLDNDGSADDLQITINKGGQVSDIFLIDAVNPTAVVFNEATAETALNNRFGTAGVDYFQFA